MKTIKDFFIAENQVDFMSAEENEYIGCVIDAVKALARVNYNGFYIVDFYTKKFLYVSDYPLFLCGNHPDKVMEMGFSFYINHVPDKDYRMLLEINRAGFNFFNQTPIEERQKMFISFDYNVLNKNKTMLINHKLTPIQLDQNGNIRLVLCIVSLSSHQDAGHVEVRIEGKTAYWTYSFETGQWHHHDNLLLSDREKEILFFASQGYTIKEIAKKLFVEEATIKFHRNHLFKKIGVPNMSAALSFVHNHKMI